MARRYHSQGIVKPSWRVWPPRNLPDPHATQKLGSQAADRGLYLKLAVERDGAITGAAHEVDLDVLATPPADRAARLISPADLTPVAPTAHAFTRVEVR